MPRMTFVLFLLAALISFAVPARAVEFQAARPVWPAGQELEKNLLVGFRAVFEAPLEGKTILRLTGSSLYRVYVNGVFCGHGPARGPHGFYRVDELDLTASLLPGPNLVALEIAGYNVNSFYLLDQPAFLQAEIVSGGRVLAATGAAGSAFQACLLPERIRKVQRFSFQRNFIECYRLRPGLDRWLKDISSQFAAVDCALQREQKLLPRGVPYPSFDLRQPVRLVSRGTLRTGAEKAELWKDRSLTNISARMKGFKESELELVPTNELQKVENLSEAKDGRPYDPDEKLSLSAGSWRILDFGTNLSGFIGATLTVQKASRLFVTFDEVLTGGDVDFKRLDCANVLYYELQPGEYRIESFEPYTLKFLKFTLFEGDCDISHLYLRELVNPEAVKGKFAASDSRLNRLFEAGRETFRQNAVDIFTDCPSRERAGWLCDSYFTARASSDLCGNTRLEKTFFENFLLPDSFAHLPKGMLPMCYPADHNNGSFIPNWALWFVLQLEEYAARSGDSATVQAARPKVLALFDYFEKFRNRDGLLEKLDNWVFVEWSKANDFVQDVSYPSNMLYAGALDAASRMYHLPELAEQAGAVRKAVAAQSWDGKFFVDNALRQGKKLSVTANHTEVCQYFAYFFGVATPETHPALWETLRTQFGPLRDPEKTFPEVFPAAPFIGKMLRLEVLSRRAACAQVLEEALGYYLSMAETTGTLWEFDGALASCNHGFASHLSHILYRDVLGLYRVDPLAREVTLRFTALPLEWCEGSRPLPDGEVYLSWRKKEGGLAYRVHAPAGYRIRVENPEGLDLQLEE